MPATIRIKVMLSMLSPYGETREPGKSIAFLPSQARCSIAMIEVIAREQ
jgi:hypothetical protein